MGVAVTGATLLVAALALGGCGEGTPGADETPEPTTVETPEPTPEETPEPTEPGELPGEPVDWGPGEGAVLAVVGVEADDVLNLRAGPGVDHDVVAEVAPLETEVLATGNARLIGDTAVWIEATVDDATGWVNLAYVGYLADTEDITYQVSDAEGADTESAARAAIDQLYPDVADLRVVIVDGPHQGDLDEVVIDVLGFADDSVTGGRLHVFTLTEGGRSHVRTIEMTPICSRGVTEGLCV